MALVTATNIKDARAITGSSLDTQLSAVASAASAQVTRFLGRSVIEAATISVETVVSIGIPIVQMNEWPISGTPTCTEAGKTLTWNTEFDSPEPYASRGQFRRISGTSPAALVPWSARPSGITFGYTAGYAASSADLAQIKLAALYQALLLWSYDPRSGSDRLNQSGATFPGGATVTYRGERWLEIALGLLEPHRRTW